MAQVNKSSNGVCPFMHKWIFVVLATAWRCVIHQGKSVWMLSGWQACYLSMLLQIFSSSAALSLATVCSCMRSKELSRDCTLGIALSSHSIYPIRKLTEPLLCCPVDLNRLIQGNMGIVTSASPACLRKTAPQRALLYISKYKKPKENLGELKKLLKKCVNSASGAKPYRSCH